MTRAACYLTALALTPIFGLSAQKPTSIVRVRVIDSSGAAVGNADVAIQRGLNDVIASGATDASGMRTFTVPRADAELELVARRIGYQRGGHFFRPDRDSLTVLVTMRIAPQTLPTVQVSAEEDLRRKRFFVGADDIANSKRPIHDALDVLTKLRPDMMDPPGAGGMVFCGIRDIWVNGTRIVYPPIDPGIAIQTGMRRRAAQIAASTPAKRPPMYTGTMRVPVTVQSVLLTIKPEHIDEMKFVNCDDSQSNDMAHGQNALFVVLKPGIGYEVGKGSYVVADKDLYPRTAPAYRTRVIGVFDEMTGAPLADAQIVDLATGSFMKTTVTGTASLVFLPEGTSAIAVRRDGYAERTLDVSISPSDTVPVTIVLAPTRKP